ncbi:RidA family protein [Acidovorax sp. BLS4]|uniref:RidA family protein n=1 Tax=Acidovorax sp. BLS4 TaxID=3273430 RepID=UPI0029431F7C|nr:RidA family protein [Paracidovorax avenae]WOI44668.1 RidA family protein [Paracidovorax avenae]
MSLASAPAPSAPSAANTSAPALQPHGPAAAAYVPPPGGQRAAPLALSFLNPDGLYDPRPNGYSHLAVAQGAARTVHVAGQGGEDVQGRLADGFAQQVAQALANLGTALAAAGAQPRDVAKLTVLIVDHSEQRLQTFGQALMAMWAGAPAPACTLIPVPRLALDGMLFEIDALAYVPAG